MIKKADIFLLIFLVIVGVALSYLSVAGSITGDKVLITVDGELYGTYSLSENHTITVKQPDHHYHTNKITIKDGKVSMSFSDCRNQICVKHNLISQTNESIVCLPNKVMVEITGKEGDYDAISN